MAQADTSEQRKTAILKILKFVQNGGDFDTAKKMFQENFEHVSVPELLRAEHQLIAGGLNPDAIQYLCDVHVGVSRNFGDQDSLNADFRKPGHPVNTLKLENVVVKSLINDFLLPSLKAWRQTGAANQLKNLQKGLSDLGAIDKHYRRKENSLFPLMNKYGITSAQQSMRHSDNQIIALIKQANALVNSKNVDQEKMTVVINKVANEVLQMITREEKIMLPMIAKVANSQDWYQVKQEEQEIGYTLIKKPMNWKPKVNNQN